MGFDQSKWVWMNGECVPWSQAMVHVSAHALHYGSGIFEGIRCYETEEGPAVFRLDAHLERLFASAQAHEIEIPYSIGELTEAVCEVIRRNDFSHCYVRPLCFYGSDSLAVHPRTCPIHVVILAWPCGAYFGSVSSDKGVRVTISRWRKFDSRTLPTAAKACGQYINSILAVRDAVNRGYDEALLLTTDGFIAEGSGENLFLVRRSSLLTNDGNHSILPGITRDVVIQLARDLGYTVEVQGLRPEDLTSTDEAFFTGTAVEVTPIREVDGKPVGIGACGPVTKQIQQAFLKATSGRNARYRHWLHWVKPQGVTSPREEQVCRPAESVR